LGDVVEESDGDLTGDGVNIAARLEGIADPGGICISEDAYRQVRDKIEIEIPLRRRLVKVGDLWELDIPAGDTKTRRPLDYPISKELSAHIDLYLARFRCRIPGADKHASLWSSNQGRPMCPDAIGAAVHKRTKAAFGFGVNLHRFRHAAASFWSIHDPVNVQAPRTYSGTHRLR
jgi:integrase